MAPSASSSAALLHLIPTRRATYNKSRKGAQRALNWPFALASSAAKPSPSTIHPDHLAAAGFHSTPTAEQPTRSTCFLCEVVVEEWAEGDQPLEVHLELNDQCGWAVLQRILTTWTDGLREKKEWKGAWGERGEWWPKSDYMISAREASFEKGWPHEGEKGVPTKEEIAAAGWFFAPGRDGDSDDQCICPFCTRTVEGWEEGDDPV
ncbi:hypothetical protein BCR35DRAFT_18663 [Leucosporidium creatinivorum]|uniref:Uncharacterized protein n=1 Tax=Leucosporidium creatinivorum TaxID=106004 RepID=A0A1Y2D0L9_9BASI|nr:hypothetical protein BCR35DRAFT_18663 [Leucosporidium creatinivorum]